EDITGMIEGLIAAYPQIQSPPTHDSQSHASHGRREECAHNTHGDLRGKNLCEAMEENDSQRPDSQKCRAQRERLALVTESIDERADRRLRDQTGDSRRGKGQPDVSWIPVQRSGEINRDEWADAHMDIGHEKVDRIEPEQS